jgi:hypothetical protein
MRHSATKVVEKIEAHILFSVTFLLPLPPPPNVEKYCKIGQATDDNMAHALCMLDN